MASLGLEGVNGVLLVSLNQPLPFNTPHTLGSTTMHFYSFLATRTFLYTSSRLSSGQNVLAYHASRSKLCLILFLGLLSVLETQKTVHVAHPKSEKGHPE